MEGTPQEGRIPILDFEREGIYSLERSEGDKYTSVALKSFRDDPEANPRKTASGKLEIYCQAAVDKVHAFGFKEIAPSPRYVPPVEGYEETFSLPNIQSPYSAAHPLELCKRSQDEGSFRPSSLHEYT